MQCYPTPFEDVKSLLELETGNRLEDMFSEFDETPIGVASLAQVHTATERLTGRKVAVKIQVGLIHRIIDCSDIIILPASPSQGIHGARVSAPKKHCSSILRVDPGPQHENHHDCPELGQTSFP